MSKALLLRTIARCIGQSDMSETLDPDVADQVRHHFSRHGLMQLLGAHLVTVERGRVVVGLAYRDEVTQHHGYFHGGGTGAIADTAGGFAGITLVPIDKTVLTVEYKVNLLERAQGDRLEAEAIVVRAGRTLMSTDFRVWAYRQEMRKLIASGQQTLIVVNLPRKPDRGTLELTSPMPEKFSSSDACD
jgi:uncharacterized protein (TIGR00369 family)